jgi:hypothetical protein
VPIDSSELKCLGMCSSCVQRMAMLQTPHRVLPGASCSPTGHQCSPEPKQFFSVDLMIAVQSSSVGIMVLTTYHRNFTIRRIQKPGRQPVLRWVSLNPAGAGLIICQWCFVGKANHLPVSHDTETSWLSPWPVFWHMQPALNCCRCRADHLPVGL